MTWLKLDDHLDENPKIAGLSDSAFRLYIWGLCYCARQRTDGLIPGSMPVRSGVRHWERCSDDLVAAGLWILREAGGWEVNDYLQWQRSKAKIAEVSEKRSAAGRKGGRPKATGDPNPNQIALPDGSTLSNPDTETDTDSSSSSSSEERPQGASPDDESFWIEYARAKATASPTPVGNWESWSKATIRDGQAVDGQRLAEARAQHPTATDSELVDMVVNGTAPPAPLTVRSCRDCGSGPFADLDAYTDHLEACTAHLDEAVR